MTDTTEKPTIGVNPLDAFKAQDKLVKAFLQREIQDALSAVKTSDGYDNFLNRVGFGADNALSGGTYEFNYITRNRIVLEAAYRGSWIIGAAIDSIAEDMVRAGITISTAEEDELERDFQTYLSRMHIWNSIEEGIKWGRLYGGAIGILQIEGQDPLSPLNVDTVAKDQFKGITIFDRWQLNPQGAIPSGPEMGLPEFYQVTNTPTGISASAPTPQQMSTFTVHHSRCIRFIGIKLPYFQAITEMMWGESELERPWDRLISFDNATMSAAGLIDRAYLRTVGVEKLRDVIASGGPAMEGLLKHFEMMRIFQVNEGLTLLDKEDTFTGSSYTFAGLADLLLQFGQQLSGAFNIPLVRLFGQLPAGLGGGNGDADIRMYYDGINAKQEARLRDPFTKIIQIGWRSKFGKPPPQDLDFEFTPLWQMSALEKADVAQKNTATVISGVDAGLCSRASGMEDLRGMSPETGLFANITDEEIEEAKGEAPPEPDGPPEPDPAPVTATGGEGVTDSKRRKSWTDWFLGR